MLDEDEFNVFYYDFVIENDSIESNLEIMIL